MSLVEFEIIKLLGKGAFAQVYQVKRKKDGNIYAMKRVKFGAMSTKEKDNALNEVRILASVQHQNIIGYKESFYDEESKTLNIIMDYADEGDLEGKIKKHIDRKTNFPEAEVWSILIQILSGLKSLHSAKIMHRDLKCANIFLKAGIIKLGDLNVSKLIKTSQMDHTQTGTPYYASPEVWSNKPYDYKSDIWSVGCIIYELCALKPPFRAVSLEELYKSVLKGKYDPIPSIYSKELNQIIAILLQVNTTLRPDVFKLLSNPLIMKKIDYSMMNSKDIDNMNMLNTIKLPKNLKEINQQLPKQKNYDIGEVILERKNSDENLKRQVPNQIDRPSYNINNRPDINKYGIDRNQNPLPTKSPTPINPTNINNNQINKVSPQDIINKDNSKVIDQRAELLKKYNNAPIQRDNDIRARPRTPDAVPKKNVYEVKRNLVPHQQVNNNNIIRPNVIQNNNQYNPYIIKKDAPILRQNNPVPTQNSQNERPKSGLPSNNQVISSNNQIPSNNQVLSNNKVLMEKNKYMNILNSNQPKNNIGGGQIIRGGVYDQKVNPRPQSGVERVVNRNITPDKYRVATPDTLKDRKITPDKYRPGVLGGAVPQSYKPYGIQNNIQSSQVRQKTPDMIRRDINAKPLIIKKK